MTDPNRAVEEARRKVEHGGIAQCGCHFTRSLDKCSRCKGKAVDRLIAAVRWETLASASDRMRKPDTSRSFACLFDLEDNARRDYERLTK